MKPEEEINRKKVYGSQTDMTLATLNHPIRMNLYNLIQQGIETIQEMATILGENRINLYHHLNYLEKNRLITSSYDNQRLKIFKLTSQTELEIQHTQSAPQNENYQTMTVVAIAREDRIKDFRKKVRDLVKEATLNISVPKDMEPAYVQIIYQNKRTIELTRLKTKNSSK